MKVAPNKTLACCRCGYLRQIFTAQPDGPCTAFCQHCQRHTTHCRKPIEAPASKADQLKALVNATRHLTARMR